MERQHWRCAPIWVAAIGTLTLAGSAVAHEGGHRHAAAASDDRCAAQHAAPEAGDAPLIADLKARVRAAPTPAAALEQLGWRLAETARDGRESGLLDEAMAISSCLAHLDARIAANMLQTYVLLSRHRFKEAEAGARRLVAERGIPFDYALLGDGLLEQGKLDEAAGAYQTALDGRPGPFTYIRAARLAYLQGRLRDAQDFAVLAIRGAGAGEAMAAVWLRTELARYLWLDGRADDALTVLNEADTISSRQAGAHALRGRILLSADRLSEAVDALRRAEALDPLPSTRWALAEALDSAGAADEASQIRDQLERSCDRHHARACALFLTTSGRRRNEALTLSTHELTVRQDALTLDAHAWALYGAERFRQAAAMIDAALQTGIRLPRIHLHAGLIAAANGDGHLAAQRLARAEANRGLLLPSERRLLDNALTTATAVARADVRF